MILTVLPVTIFDAFASSVSMCISSVKLSCTRICTWLNTVPALVIRLDGYDVAVFDACGFGVFRGHMNMPFRDDAALVQVNSALGAYQSDRCAACDISRFADGRFHSQFQSVCGGYLHLRFTAARSEYAHVFNGAKF